MKQLLKKLTQLFTHDKTSRNRSDKRVVIHRLPKVQTCANDAPFTEWNEDYCATEDEGEE